jgi:hypothetical protein
LKCLKEYFQKSKLSLVIIAKMAAKALPNKTSKTFSAKNHIMVFI